MFPPSPSLSPCDSVLSPEDLDAYFENYVPLSKFPTPPLSDALAGRPSKKRTYADMIVRSESDDIAAQALAELTPIDACSDRPYTAIIASYLAISRLPPEIVGLAANILHALSAAFLPSWRAETLCPDLLPMDMPMERITREIRTKPAPAELIVLAALATSMAYLDDRPFSLAIWSEDVSKRAFTTQQIDLARRCLLADLDYRLHPLATPQMINGAIAMLESGGSWAAATSAETAQPLKLSTNVRPPKLSFRGTAITRIGLCTPEPSPTRLMSGTEYGWNS
ncbi:hypothetical protein LTR50_002161 [Elasticomyces elasticus]|nr:hypothetical protein LTR50_002161 [Elasticomyces elasticus]